MRKTVKELLRESIIYDEPFLAHAIYYAVQKGLVKLEDPESNIPYDDLDYEAIKEMRDDNILEMCTVKLFVVPMASKQFAIYLAEKEDDARKKHHKIYRELVQEVVDVTDKMDTSIYCEDTRNLQSFREMKQQVLHFPYFAGEMSGH